MMIPRAAAITFILGLLAGGLGVFGVAVLIVVWAQGAAAGWRSRHVEAAGKLWRARL